MADSRGEGVVDGRVTERTGDADAREIVVRVDRADDTDDRAELEERDGGRGIIEVDLPRLERRLHCRWERVDVDFEADRQRRLRTHATLDDLIELERVGPEGLVTIGVEAKNGLALGNERRVERSSVDAGDL